MDRPDPAPGEVLVRVRATGINPSDVKLRSGARRVEIEAALSSWLENGALRHAVVPAGGLDDIATAHEMVEAGEKLGTVVLEI